MEKITESVIECRLYKGRFVSGCVIDGSIAINCSGCRTEDGMLFLTAGSDAGVAKLPISTIKDVRIHFDVIIITLKRH